MISIRYRPVIVPLRYIIISLAQSLLPFTLPSCLYKFDFISSHKMSHNVNTVVGGGVKSERGWLDCEEPILTSHGALAHRIKFQTYTNKASLEEVLRPSQLQHLAPPTQETWGHSPLFRECRHTPAASHVPSQTIVEWADYQGKRHADTKQTEMRKYTGNDMRFSGDISLIQFKKGSPGLCARLQSKGEFSLPFFGLTYNTHTQRFFNRFEQLKPGLAWML